MEVEQEEYGSNKKIGNIRLFESLNNLQHLHLHDCLISDISFLKNLTNLQFLNLGDNQIKDISALQQLTKLDLSGGLMSHNKISG